MGVCNSSNADYSNITDHDDKPSAIPDTSARPKTPPKRQSLLSASLSSLERTLTPRVLLEYRRRKEAAAATKNETDRRRTLFDRLRRRRGEDDCCAPTDTTNATTAAFAAGGICWNDERGRWERARTRERL